MSKDKIDKIQEINEQKANTTMNKQNKYMLQFFFAVFNERHLATIFHYLKPIEVVGENDWKVKWKIVIDYMTSLSHGVDNNAELKATTKSNEFAKKREKRQKHQTKQLGFKYQCGKCNIFWFECISVLNLFIVYILCMKEICIYVYVTKALDELCGGSIGMMDEKRTFI